MSDDSKSFEKKLDRDFLFYLNLTKELYDKVSEDSEKLLCEVWLTHLVGKTRCSPAEKCDRNIFLSRLLLQMQNGRLQGVFREVPPSGVLPNAFTTFGLPSDVEGVKGFENMGFQIDNSTGGGSGDFFESSRDGRTYIASRKIPQGIMAFLAVTNNEGDEVWMPQMGPSGGASEAEGGAEAGAAAAVPGTSQGSSPRGGGFVKKLAQITGVPISQKRKTPEERERVIEWMDKIIDDCGKWIQGRDPHNMDLEALFELLYEDYKCDPEKAEIFKHPRKLRTILMRDIRDKLAERRMEITKRELILDQYEADEYTEERLPGADLDEVWLQCARKPMMDQVKMELDSAYPPEVVQRFFELLVQERIYIIEKGEAEANRRIAELRKGSLDDIKNELQRLKKVQDDYKEYYCIYKEIELRQADYEREWKEKCARSERPDQETNTDTIKKEIELEIEQARRRFDKERRLQVDVYEKLEEAKEAYMKVKERANNESEKLICERNQIQLQREDLEEQLRVQIRRQEELRRKIACKRNE